MKKILKWIGISVGALVLLVVIASVALMLIVDEPMIASQMENVLHRHVTIEKISVNIFSIVSGIEVKEVKISNFKNVKQLAALQGKPVPDSDLFVGLKAFKFKLKFMPLFSGSFVLNEIVLYEPVINVIKYKTGAFNFSDLTAPSGKEKEKPEEVKKEEPKEPSKPFTADDLPIDINIGKIGIEKGQLKYTDMGMDQVFQVYDLTTLVHSIAIDPKNLDKKDSVGLKVKMGVKTLGKVNSGSVKSFDLGLDITGNIIPFDKKTRIANPEITAKAGLPYGDMTGLQIFDKMKSVESLSKYCGKLDFLKDSIKWKNAFVDIWYKNGTVKLTNGKIPTEDYELGFSGSTNINTKAVNLDLNMLLADKHQDSVKKGIQSSVAKSVKLAGAASKYIKPEQVTDIAMKRMLDKNGKLTLIYKVTGTMAKPDTKLIQPALPTISDLVKESAGNVKDVAKDKAKDAATKAVDQNKDKAVDKTKDKLKGKLKF